MNGEQLRLLASGSLAEAIDAYAPRLEHPVNSAAVLAELMDLRGGYALAEALSDLEVQSVVPPSAEARQLALDRLQAVLDGLERVAERRRVGRRNAYKGRYRFPRAKRLEKLVTEAGPGAARLAWAPMAEFLDVWLKRARFDIRDLRREAWAALDEVSGDPARLSALDRALAVATHRQLEAQYRRVPLAAEARFIEAFNAAVAEGTEPERIEAWWADGGWIKANFEAAWRLTEALVSAERRQLEAFVEAGRTLMAAGGA